jgi:acyl-CoA synthetase (AMP-forming)/AMP-acid ligase II
MVSHDNLASNERCIQQSFCQTAESVVVSWLPMFHDMGLIGTVLQPLHVGCHAVLMSPMAFVAKPVRWLQAIGRYKATTSGGPNFGYEHSLKRIKQQEKEQLDLSSWRVAYNGSEPVRAETLARFADAFRACGFRPRAFFPCYGLAEATLFVSGGPVDREPRVMNLRSPGGPQTTAVDAPNSERDRPVVSCGQIAADVDVVIVDPERRVPLETGAIGEIWLRGGSITNGYWNNDPATRESFEMRLADSSSGPAFFRSGDLGFLDGDELFVTGRIKDLIIVRGRNIYPQDVEHLITELLPFGQHNSVTAFMVDKGMSEALGVVIEADRSLVHLARAYAGIDGGPARSANQFVDLDRRLAEFSTLLNDIRDAVSHEFDISVACFAFLPPGAFPRTSSGKVQRSLCRAGLLSRTMPLLNLPECVTQASHSIRP